MAYDITVREAVITTAMRKLRNITWAEGVTILVGTLSMACLFIVSVPLDSANSVEVLALRACVLVVAVAIVGGFITRRLNHGKWTQPISGKPITFLMNVFLAFWLLLVLV